MKSYKNLYEQLISEENIKLAIHNASLGKRDRALVRHICKDPDRYIPFLTQKCEKYSNDEHIPKEIYDGITRKKRTILVPSHYEQIVHHMIVNVLKPIFMSPMYEHSYGSIPGRGAHMAKKNIEKWIRTDCKNTKYCLKMDIRKYFDSIPHNILKAKLRRILYDEKFLEVLYTIVDVQPVGIPLGFYTSQWFANYYLTSLDHYIKEHLCAKYYVRYMDDMVILGGNKRELHAIRAEIEDYLNKVLGLQMKDNWQVFKIEYTDQSGKTHGRPLDFMGFKFYRNRTTLRRSIMLRSSRKARKLSKKRDITIHDCRQMLAYVGWTKCTDVYDFCQEWINPYVNIRYLRKRVSEYDRRHSICGKKQNIA